MQIVTQQPQNKNKQSAIISKCQFSEIGLKIPDGTTRAEWCEIGNYLGRIKAGWEWCVGDWVAYGRKHFKEDVDEYFDSQTWFDFAKTKKLADVAEAYYGSRKHELEFAHHEAVNKWVANGKITKKEAEYWLKRAIAENLTPNDLSLSIAHGGVVRAKQLDNESLPTIEAFIVLIERWNQRITRVDPIENWDAEKAKLCLAKLQPVGDIIKRLVARVNA